MNPQTADPRARDEGLRRSSALAVCLAPARSVLLPPERTLEFLLPQFEDALGR